MLLFLCAFLFTDIHAGPYSGSRNDPSNPFDPPLPGFVGPAGDGCNTPENKLNPLFVAWASETVRYAPAAGLDAIWADPAAVLGPVTGDQFDIAALGELEATALDAGAPPGAIVVAFTPYMINDGPGPDFAVFENGFDGFMELAFVEVSSDGVHFARFPARSLTASPVPPYTPFDPTGVFNLAGKHHNNNGESWGTPFDLSMLAADPLVLAGKVRLDAIRQIRLVDIPGRGDFPDATGAPVYDPWPTFGSGGFDLEAVGMIHARVELRRTPAGLEWDRIPHRLNRLQRSTESPAGPWESVVESTDGPETIAVPVQPAGLEYYRVRLERLP